MPKRTAAANRAILEAWEREARLVGEGLGTRDWTIEQQRDILDPDRGKAYDDRGRAFQGQHMKSVEKYPEYQGDPENIQFLTLAEHLEAHKGSWQNPTNWYYDPVTKQFFDFGENRFVPCKIIELSNPVVDIYGYEKSAAEDVAPETKKEPRPNVNLPIRDAPQPLVTERPIVTSPSGNKTHTEKAINGIEKAVKATIEVLDEHPAVATVLKVGAGMAVAAVVGKAINGTINTNRSGRTRLTLPSGPTETIVKTVVDTASHIDIKNTQSILKQLGYSVAKSVSMSDVDRQRILQEVISGGTMTKEVVCAYLKFNINLHKNQGKLTEAVGKWIADLAFVTDQL